MYNPKCDICFLSNIILTDFYIFKMKYALFFLIVETMCMDFILGKGSIMNYFHTKFIIVREDWFMCTYLFSNIYCVYFHLIQNYHM